MKVTSEEGAFPGAEMSWRWVEFSELEHTWRPADLALGHEFPTSDGLTVRYSRLGDLVGSVPRTIRRRLPPASWILRPSGGSIEFMQTQDTNSVSATRLPPEAIVVGRIVRDRAPVDYWSDEYFPGGGVATSEIIVLRPSAERSVAWLVDELGSEECQRQIQASVTGSVIPRIGVAALLALQVRLPPSRELEARSRLVMETARQRSALLHSVNRSSLARQELKPVLLTGASFEDRLAQFEEYLLGEEPVAREDMFFVEALTKDPEADLFTVRSLGARASGDIRQQGLIPQGNRAADVDWRRWYWRTDAGAHTSVFDSLVGEGDLPANLVLRTTGSTAQLPESLPPASVLPTFRFLRDVVESVHDDSEVAPTQISDEAVRAWARFQQTGRRHRTLRKWRAEQLALGVVPTEREGLPGAEQLDLNLAEPEYRSGIPSGALLLEWLRQVFRPALALKVLRDGQVAGVYLLFGPDQLEHPDDVRALLDGYGARLSEILLQPSGMLEDAARRESLRRLSWVMHQLNFPTGRALNAVRDIKQFLLLFPEVGKAPVPDAATATKRAAMNEESIEKHSLSARLADAELAVNEIRKVSYQIRRLRSVQGNLPRTKLDLGRLLSSRVDACRQELPELRVELHTDDPLFALGNEDAVVDAINEVLSNACRELREHAVVDPTITVTAWTQGPMTFFTIRDNALPPDVRLISDPFDENASAYASQGRGSGLGLAIVRETFRGLGGRCRLFANNGASGERLAGVTFEGELPGMEDAVDA